MRALILAVLMLGGGPALAGSLVLVPEAVTEWKPVYGTVEPLDNIPVRSRMGGIIEELLVTEGDTVSQGQRIAMVHDEKIGFQIAALDAQIEALQAQLRTAETELQRGETLVARGAATRQQLDQLRTNVDVTRGQIASAEASRAVLVQQQAEGEVVASENGRILTVPAARGAVILPGEAVATIASGQLFLRLAVPERHANALAEGDVILIGTAGSIVEGRLAKIYPQITGGRVMADVAVAELPGSFVNARVPVALPVAEYQALLVPEAAISTRSGIDFVTVMETGAEVERAVLRGRSMDGRVEILSGLRAGDEIIVP